MWERVEAGLKQSFRQYSAVRAVLAELEEQVSMGDTAASVAARRLLAAFFAEPF